MTSSKKWSKHSKGSTRILTKQACCKPTKSIKNFSLRHFNYAHWNTLVKLSGVSVKQQYLLKVLHFLLIILQGKLIIMQLTDLISFSQKRTDFSSFIHECCFSGCIATHTVCIITSSSQKRTQQDTKIKTVSLLAPQDSGRRYQGTWLSTKKHL